MPVQDKDIKKSSSATNPAVATTGADKIKKSVRKWEKRWVLQPNVLELGSDVWLPKWIMSEESQDTN